MLVLDGCVASKRFTASHKYAEAQLLSTGRQLKSLKQIAAQLDEDEPNTSAVQRSSGRKARKKDQVMEAAAALGRATRVIGDGGVLKHELL